MALCSYCLNTRTQQKLSLKPSFIKAEQVQFSQPFLTGQAAQSFDHLCGPSVAPLQAVHISCIAGTKTERSIPGVDQPSLNSGIMTSFLLMSLLRQPSMLLSFFAAAARCSLILTLLSTRTLGSISTELLPS